MTIPTGNGLRRYIKYAIIVLIIIFVLLATFFVIEYRALRRAQIITAHQLWLTSVLKHHNPLTANDVNVIRPWMTFDYINKLFKLPPEYLKNSLTIADPRYPQISLSGYAKSVHLDATTFMGMVSTALRDYLTVPAK